MLNPRAPPLGPSDPHRRQGRRTAQDEDNALYLSMTHVETAPELDRFTRARAELQIRPAVPADAPAMSAIDMTVHDLHLHALSDLFQSNYSSVWSPAHIAALLAKPDHIISVAVQDSTVVGYSYAELQEIPTTSVKRARRRLYLHQIGVAESHRRKGVGTFLLNAMQEAATANSVNDVALHVYAFNEEARAFYRTRGFTLFTEQLWMPVQSAPYGDMTRNAGMALSTGSTLYKRVCARIARIWSALRG
jgi:ribosomal protein S18 acetylase RimI-like enzyme